MADEEIRVVLPGDTADQVHDLVGPDPASMEAFVVTVVQERLRPQGPPGFERAFGRPSDAALDASAMDLLGRPSPFVLRRPSTGAA
ncbi:hypothetical protein F0L68_41240 [Solihabitans fulvus]|uniref:Uncharacterized protein n=1 Tax=Solihabitans fulvus TaxID=1892852 RepID=A0A5B2W412_9PSEU|nr:hypothetical protein [Solihabitans fulvus]KAA2245874.1 hypothetical protein F0L68_41240 [Solihabitans fulvus]